MYCISYIVDNYKKSDDGTLLYKEIENLLREWGGYKFATKKHSTYVVMTICTEKADELQLLISQLRLKYDLEPGELPNPASIPNK
jgi:hypothetical protein